MRQFNTKFEENSYNITYTVEDMGVHPPEFIAIINETEYLAFIPKQILGAIEFILSENTPDTFINRQLAQKIYNNHNGIN